MLIASIRITTVIDPCLTATEVMQTNNNKMVKHKSPLQDDINKPTASYLHSQCPGQLSLPSVWGRQMSSN